MAFLVNNNEVIDDSANLTNIAGLSGNASSLFDEVLYLNVGRTLKNRDYAIASVKDLIFELPSTPIVGNEIIVGVLQAPLRVSPGSTKKIMNSSEDFILDISNSLVKLTYINDTFGWFVS
jgi:hypothetical protein